MENIAGWVLGTIVSAFLGSFLAAYMKKRGENLATHEDFEKVLAELKQTTQSTKAIEFRISDEMWNKQRRWELKRDAVYAVVQSMGLAGDALMYMSGVYALGEGTEQSEEWNSKVRELSLTWHKHMDEFDQKRFIASFVGSDELEEAMRALSNNMRESAGVVLRREMFSISEMFGPIRRQIGDVRKLAKTELGLDQKI